MRNKSYQVTAADVAKLAGVSPASVRRVFNPDWSLNVKEDIKNRVEAAAKELNYTPNMYARMLASNRSNMIAVVLGSKTGKFYSQVFMQFLYQAQSRGRQVLPFTLKEDMELNKIVDVISQYRVDAIVVTSAANYLFEQPVSGDVPVIVFFDQVNEESNIASIQSDSYNGGQIVADILLDNGHEKIAFISGNGGKSKDFKRENGFADRMMARGIKLWKKEIGIYADYVSGRDAVDRIMSGEEHPDAIFCADDILAMAAIDTLRYSYNKSVPEDISVIGFHDIAEAALPAYALTTIHSPISELVQATLEYIEHIDEYKDGTFKRLLKMRPIIRETVRITNPEYEKFRLQDDEIVFVTEYS